MMNKEIIDKIINENRTIEFLEKLELRGLDSFDTQYKRLLEILMYTYDSAADIDVALVKQYILRKIYEVLPKILPNEDYVNDLISLLNIDKPKSLLRISDLIKAFLRDIFIDNNFKEKEENTLQLVSRLNLLNSELLQNSIKGELDHNYITSIFYNSIRNIDKNDKFLLEQSSIQIYIEYVKNAPLKYLSNFIRPYYTMSQDTDFLDYFRHAPEPFWEQVFGDMEKFYNYLQSIKSLDENLITDIKLFMGEMQKNQGTDGVILFSIDNKYTRNALKLLSEKHINIRLSCKPPSYTVKA